MKIKFYVGYVLRMKCKYLTCKRPAKYNYLTHRQIAEWCHIHKKKEMYDVVRDMCENCHKKRASHNFKGEKAKFCDTCKKPDMIRVDKKMCEKCEKVGASFNLPGQKQGKFCSKCKKPGMINVKKKRCKCGKRQPRFNFSKEKLPICCDLCKKKGMVNLVDKKCKCGKRLPSFAYLGMKKEYCRECKLEGMVKVKKKVCFCKRTTPSFNYKGKPPKYCKECKKEGMINVTHLCKKCKNNTAKHGSPKSKTASHCDDCKEPGMVDLRFARCKCGKGAMYGPKNSKKPTACGKHKTAGMIETYRVNCTEENCDKKATHGIPNSRKEKCGRHRTSEMIVNPRKKCKTKNCNEVATFGVKVPISCESHKTNDNICLVERVCKKCDRIDVLSPNKLCINFCEAEEKYKIYKKQSKLKEESLFNVLKHAFPGFSIRRENIEDSSCTLARTDFEFDCKTHVIIVECDEGGDSHANRNCSLGIEGDQNRLKNICFAYGGTPVVFLKFNPDKYKTTERNLSVKEREKMLICVINYFIENRPEIQYSVAYLFFNGFTTFKENYFEIDLYDTFLYKCPFCEILLSIKSTWNMHCKNCKNVPDNFLGIDENNIYFLEKPKKR